MKTKPEIISCKICETTDNIINVAFKFTTEELNYCKYCLTYLMNSGSSEETAKRTAYEKQQELKNQIKENQIMEELRLMIMFTNDRQALKRKFQNLIEDFELYEQNYEVEDGAFERILIAKPIIEAHRTMITRDDIFN